MKRFLAGFVLVIALLGLFLGWAQVSGYRVILTASVPVGLWQVKPLARPLRDGDTVWLCPPDTPVFRDAKARGYLWDGDCPGHYLHLMKPVAAVAGDTVQVSRAGVAVNGRMIPNSRPSFRDPKGRSLAMFPAGLYRVPVGQVWLVSHYHPRSYDSRYYGPVPVRQIEGVAQPVWIKKGVSEK